MEFDCERTIKFNAFHVKIYNYCYKVSQRVSVIVKLRTRSFRCFNQLHFSDVGFCLFDTFAHLNLAYQNTNRVFWTWYYRYEFSVVFEQNGQRCLLMLKRKEINKILILPITNLSVSSIKLNYKWSLGLKPKRSWRSNNLTSKSIRNTKLHSTYCIH